MSRSGKISLFAALAFGVLFVAVLLLRNDEHGPGDSARYQAPAWLRAAGESLLGFTPRIEMPAPVLTIKPGATREIAVAFADTGFRGARLRLERGDGVDIAYLDRTVGGLEQLREQNVMLPHDGRGDPRQTSIIAMKQGGTLTLRCRGSNPCVLAVK